MQRNRQRFCAVIPVNDHERNVTELVTRLIVAGFDCLLVDNRSSSGCTDVLDRLTRQDRVFLLRMPRKPGKGSAVLAGMREARQLGYTHALRVDPGCQDELNALPSFIRYSLAAPDAMVCGYRVSRTRSGTQPQTGNILVRLMIAISTLSCDIKDAGCSFRIYPLEAVLRLAGATSFVSHAGFDTDILVRMHWNRQPMYWLPVLTRASSDSDKRDGGWHDKRAAVRMHGRLLIGMLARAPQLLWCRRQG